MNQPMDDSPGLTRDPYTFQPMDPTVTMSPSANRELPDGWPGSLTVCVALAGARASGKSLYVAVLVKLLRQLADEHGVVMKPANRQTKDSYAVNYENPFFEEMGLLSSTPPVSSAEAYQRDPLIYDLGFHVINGGEQRKVFLVLRDVAGEDLESLPEDQSVLDFFQWAHEVIYLFDPLKVSEIRLLLEGTVSAESLGADATDVLNNLLQVIRPGALAQEGRPRPRLAVALSKFDTLRSLANSANEGWAEIMGNRGAAFNRQLEPSYWGSDPELLNEEIRSMLLRLDARTLLNTVRQEAEIYGMDVRYFVNSSLGSQPQGSRLDRTGIAPFRVLDPVLWLLYDAGIFWPTTENHQQRGEQWL
ncbi:TRAFAC clade GTPase domain-containing protein [Corynebacterium doosanense]|uniref:Double-GTPase 2 domain-containing protein n=1 Tax=Corynebacterium doosanense CAU 212 = DSM 45436 TaxID=558173 RepID=A0A097IDT5_9CORY|nr:hypothetical protein [Corynebacterium doosanense]AIT60284.1 hypothetical protein CDOO_02740 [Corynebacterium doosanense CAU 212 = DSM 45436]